MQIGRPKHWLAAIASGAALLSLGAPGVAADFNERLARVDEALRKNPGGVNERALESCLRQRNYAVRLYDRNQMARADRSLEYCYQVLRISEKRLPPRAAPPSIEEVQAKAARELEQALALSPDLENGLEIYRGCAPCHTPEGWGLRSGIVPALAGQHEAVIIKQLADIRAGNRQNVSMAPYAAVEVIGGAQAVADVAGYIATLEMSTAGGKGPGDQLELGERLYGENCARCHGANGEGDAEAFVPRIQNQHFKYLTEQFEKIRDGRRRNANAEMKEQIQGFEEQEVRAIMDFVSRLEPPPELQAPSDWRNPDFAE